MSERDQAVPPPPSRINRLVGVYDADGTLGGELAYWIGVRLGRTHCGLCDITHGLVRERADWKDCRSSLPVPFETYHRNDQPNAVRSVVGSDLPAVLADSERGLITLLGPRELDACQGSPAAMQDALREAVRREKLVWSEP